MFHKILIVLSLVLVTSCGSTYSTGFRQEDHRRVLQAISDEARTRGYRPYGGGEVLTVHIGEEGLNLQYTAYADEKEIQVAWGVPPSSADPKGVERVLREIHAELTANIAR